MIAAGPSTEGRPAPLASILVVDDDPTIRGLIEAILSTAGFAVESVPDAMAGLERMEQHRPDVVILDLMLPGTSGLEACRQIRERHGRTVAILMVSARGRGGVIEGLNAGADDYLAKPFDVGELEARVRTLLRARALERSALRRADRLLSLQRISSALVGRVEEEEIIDLVLDEARRLLDATAVALYLWDAEHQLLRPSRLSPPSTGAVPRQPGRGIVGQAFALRRPVWVNDYERWPHASADSVRAGVWAAVAAPLVLGDEVLGVVSARTTTPGATVDEEDAQLLGLLASHAAVAIANARAYAAQRAAAARAASRARELETVLETMTDGVLIVDGAGTITSANRSAATILGRPDGVLAGAPLDTVLPPLRASDEQGDARRPDAAELVRRLRTQPDEVELVGEIAGQERLLAVSALPIGGAGVGTGGPSVLPEGVPGDGTLIVLRDVTHRRQMEERAAEAEKLRALGQMASGVAHDVNNLLAAVLGRAELARLEVERGEIDPPRLFEALRLIEQAAEDGARTVRRIQEFARVRRDAGLAVVDLAQLVRDTVDLTRPGWRDGPQTEGRRIAVEIDVEPDLPVAAEPSELREVLTNLILNAVEAMPEGGLLRFSGRREGEMIRLEVSDTGVGMSRAVSRRVFEPFFTTKVEGGTGLGLAISYGIIRRRAGQLSVTSAPGAGTTFTIELPLARPLIPAPAPAPPAVVHPEPEQRHVLVAEDEAALASIVQRLLVFEGFEVTVCGGGEEAVRRFDPAVHDLVLTDYGMPDLTGVQVAAEVKRRSPKTPVVLVTGWGNELDPDHPPPGVTLVMAKPYRLAALVEAINGALGAGVPAASGPA